MDELWLFDIDGTLINVSHLHLEAHQYAYKHVLGLDVPKELIVKMFGLPAQKEREMILRAMGFPEVTKINEVIVAFQKRLQDALSSELITPLPGVVEMLTLLQKDSCVLGVITANQKEHAEWLLRKAKLNSFFSVVSADTGGRRVDILKKAISSYPSFRTVVVGDTVHDLEAARDAGVIAVAVATGSCSVEELQQRIPEVLVSSLQDYKQVIVTVRKLWSQGMLS